jgi:hypothetical protein
LVAQVTPPTTTSAGVPIDSHVRYVLQDANYNVTGLVRACDARVIRQFRYEPYGQFTAVEGLDTSNTSYPMVEITNSQLYETFQGLHSYWHDAETISTAHGAATNSAGTAFDLTGHYVMGVRILPPHFGRPNQRDPNGQALVLTNVLASNAQTKSAFAFVDAAMQYADGMSPYGLFLDNPNTNRDPSGLSANFDWFGEADEMELEITCQKLYTLGTINEGARWAAIGLQTALDIGGSLLGVDMFQSVHLLSSGQGGFWDSMNIFLSVAPFGSIGKAGGKLAKAFDTARTAGKASRLGRSAARHLFKILPYNQAQKLTKGFGGDIMAHHILEARHLRSWGRHAEVPNVPAVILTRQQHDEITQLLKIMLPYSPPGRTIRYEKEHVLAVYKKVYTRLGYSEWLQHIEKYFR